MLAVGQGSADKIGWRQDYPEFLIANPVIRIGLKSFPFTTDKRSNRQISEAVKIHP